MKKILFPILMIASIFATAQEGNPFPAIDAANLNDKSISLPIDTKGKFTLVGVAFSEDAQNDLYTWGAPVYDLFLDENGLNAMVYDVNVHLVLLFTGVNKAAYNKAEKMIKEGTTDTYRENILFYKGEMGDLRDELAMEDRKVPYLYVLDKEGTIIYTTSGRYTRKKMDEISELVED
jgi:hypothetical protein